MATPTLQHSPQPSILPTSSIKELCDSSVLSSVPSYYSSRNPEAVETIVEEEIPVIDYSLLTRGTPGQRSQLVRDLGKACQDWGFFMVMNHGVPESLRAAMLDAAEKFFNLTEEEKMEYVGKHVTDPIRCGTSFNTAVDKVRFWRDYLKIIVHPEFHSPSKPQGFRNIALKFSTEVRNVAKEILRGIWESLGLEESHMEKALDLQSSFQSIILNLYPPCPQPQLAIGMPPHSDHGLLIMLIQNGINGLQVKHNGKWVQVKPHPNSFLVNIGDHMEIISNGMYKSVLHRAEVNNTSTRMSIVTALGPSLETVVVPAPQLVNSSDHRAAFRGMKYGEYFELQQSSPLKEKSALDILRLQAE